MPGLRASSRPAGFRPQQEAAGLVVIAFAASKVEAVRLFLFAQIGSAVAAAATTTAAIKLAGHLESRANRQPSWRSLFDPHLEPSR